MMYISRQLALFIIIAYGKADNIHILVSSLCVFKNNAFGRTSGISFMLKNNLTQINEAIRKNNSNYRKTSNNGDCISEFS